MKTACWIIALAGWTLIATAAPRIVCTTFPIHQITRQVTEGETDLSVDCLLPAALGCPHDYALTPRDLMKLAAADVLIINGQGMEEFLGAPVHNANPDLHIIDSSSGISGLLPHSSGSTEQPFEWAGLFELKAGTYTWTMAKVAGAYADPVMALLVLPAETATPAALVTAARQAEEAFTRPVQPATDNTPLAPAPTPWNLQLDEALATNTFYLNITSDGTYAIFTEHLPFEFEADVHFFKDVSGVDMEPVAQLPDPGSHDEHGHHHDHEHDGINPHLFASPALSGEIALNIARELGLLMPDRAERFMERAQTYADAMNALTKRMRSSAETWPNRRIVQPHGIFDYLARDIGLDIIAVTQPHGQEPSAAEMLRLLDLIRRHQVAAIVIEPQYSPKVGQTLATETDLPVILLDPGASGPENAPLNHFESIMRKNLESLKTTLGRHGQ
jgi:ABC-type Zn uptake system ZnuABC Zn-binding protein ZnuA